jgi:2-polyprenyl-3-methyl-5-hydroxy-6-metoxy-1,4-benzoquinol methylase
VSESPDSATPHVAPAGIQLIDLSQLEDLLRRADEVRERGTFTDRWEFLADYRLQYDQAALPDDPFSEEYRRAQLDLYRLIANVSEYDPRLNEVISVDIDERLRQPAPFDAGSTAAAGDHLIAYGHLCRLLDLHPGDRVLEYGAGQGNISLLLATMGLDVTAIDISPDFIELIRRRAARDDVPLTAVLGEFGDPPPDKKPVDAILFFEAFHHSFDHVALVRSLRELLCPGGRVLFAGEPILESPAQPWVGPWGVRIDGVSLGAIRQDHCFELGFSVSYFVRMMMRNGFLVTFHGCAETDIGNTWIARRNDGVIAPNQLKLPPDEERSWGPGSLDPLDTFRYAGAMTRLTLDDDIGWRAVQVRLRNHLHVELSATVSLGAPCLEVNVGPGAEAVVALPLASAPRMLVIDSETAVPPHSGAGADPAPVGLAVVQIELER